VNYWLDNPSASFIVANFTARNPRLLPSLQPKPMKQTLIKSLLLSVVAILGVATASAQTSPKVLTVDIDKVLEKYWKMPEYTKTLQDFVNSSNADLKKQFESVTEVANAINKLNEDIAKAVEKDKAGLQAQRDSKNVEYQSKVDTFNTQQKAQEVNNQLVTRARQDVLAVADKLAKEKKADLLIYDIQDVAKTRLTYGTFTPTDVTAEVLTEINKGHETETKASGPLTVPATK
jgi:Skp family chaperone for outer membrane proteins